MAYIEALEVAGATILAYESFGSYQGDWFAKVSYQNRVFWVHGSYGSCSGCDAFEAEFGFNFHDHGEEYFNPYKVEDLLPGCESCEDYKTRLIAFGLSYLTSGEMTQTEAETDASRNLEWDSDAQEMVDFVKANKL